MTAASEGTTAGKLRQLIQLTVSVGLCVSFAFIVGVDDIVAALTSVPATILLVLAAVLGLQFFVVALRSVVLLRSSGVSITLAAGYRIFILGVVANSILINVIGGVLTRLFLLHRIGVSPSRAVPSLVAEKGLTLAALLILFAMSLPFTLFGASESLLVLLVTVTMIGFCAAIIPALVYLGTRLQAWQWLQQVVQSMRSSWLALARDPVGTMQASALTLVSLVLLFAGYAIAAIGIGAPVSTLDLLLVLPAVTIAASLPISIGGWGVRELSMVAALQAFGVPAFQAIAISALVGITCMIVPIAFYLCLSLCSLLKARSPLEQN